MFRENEYRASAGFSSMFFLIVVDVLAIAGLANGARNQLPLVVILSLIVVTVASVAFAGLFIVNPGEAKALVLGNLRFTASQENLRKNEGAHATYGGSKLIKGALPLVVVQMQAYLDTASNGGKA